MMSTYRLIIILIIIAVFAAISSGCKIDSKYKTRSFQTEEERQAIDVIYNPPAEQEEEEKEIEPFLKGVEGPVVKVNGLEINAKDIRDLYEYFASHRSEDTDTLKREAASQWIQTYAVMSQWPDQIQPALDRMQVIRDSAEKGIDFRNLIIENSQEPGAAENAGDLGTIQRGMMVPIFEMHVFTDPINEIIGPFPTVFGLHMVQITERNTDDPKNPNAKARHLLLFHGLDPANGDQIRQNSTRWANTATVELLNEELYDILPRYAPRPESPAPASGE